MIESILEKDYTYRKADNWQLIESLNRLGMTERADKIASCGTQLQWLESVSPPRLIGANFCKDRLCNMCIWRRTDKVFAQVSSVMDVLEERASFQYVFLTLTVRNCSGTSLAENIDWLFKAFGLFLKDKRVKKAFKGFFRSLEVTYHPEYVGDLQFHPHLHIIFAVNKTYFRSPYYLDIEDIRQIWRHCLEVYYGDMSWFPPPDWTPRVGRPAFGTVRKDLGYDPVCYIEKVKAKVCDDGTINLKAAVSEVAKYTVTYDTLFHANSYAQIDHGVRCLSEALSGRRLCAFGGVLRDVARELKLDDAMEGDLVNTDNQKVRLDVGAVVSWYNWNVGAGGYFFAGRRVLQESDFVEEDPLRAKELPWHARLRRVVHSDSPELKNVLMYKRQRAVAVKTAAKWQKYNNELEKSYENIRAQRGVYNPLYGATLEAVDDTWVQDQLGKTLPSGD